MSVKNLGDRGGDSAGLIPDDEKGLGRPHLGTQICCSGHLRSK